MICSGEPRVRGHVKPHESEGREGDGEWEGGADTEVSNRRNLTRAELGEKGEREMGTYVRLLGLVHGERLVARAHIRRRHPRLAANRRARVRCTLFDIPNPREAGRDVRPAQADRSEDGREEGSEATRDHRERRREGERAKDSKGRLVLNRAAGRREDRSRRKRASV